MPSNPPAGTPQLYPRIAYRDPTRAVAWLSSVFGLRERPDARIGDGQGGIALTEMTLGAGLVMIGGDGGHGLESPAKLGGCTQMVIGYVDGIGAHHARAQEAGAEIVSEPRDQPWGDRRYEALDLEGHRWYFAEHLRDVPPEEWKRALGG